MTDTTGLVDAAIAKDETAVAEIYDTFAPSIYAFCLARLGDSHDAADATQDTFIKAIQRLDQLRDHSQLRSWLLTTARREVANQGRRRSRTRPTADPQESGTEEEPTKHLSEVELAELVTDAAVGLVERDQEVLALHLGAGLGSREIAEALGVDEAHARVLLNRMKTRLGSAISLLLVARWERAHCQGLDHLLADWDGRFTPEVRSRVQGHVGGCGGCGAARRRLTRPEALLPASLTVAVPEILRTQVLTGLGATAPAGVGAAIAGSAGLVAGVGVSAGKIAIGALIVGSAAVAATFSATEPQPVESQHVEATSPDAAAPTPGQQGGDRDEEPEPGQGTATEVETETVARSRPDAQPDPRATPTAADDASETNSPNGQDGSKTQTPAPESTPEPGQDQPDPSPPPAQGGGPDPGPDEADGLVDEVTTVVGETVRGAGDAVGQTTDAVGKTLDDVGQTLGGPVQDITDSVGDILDDPLDSVNDTVGDVTDGLGDITDDLGGITNGLGGITNGLGGITDGLGDLLDGAGGSSEEPTDVIDNLLGGVF